MTKEYSEISFGIDLIVEVYKTYNPIIIADKLETDLNIELTIDQIIDYFEILKIDYKYDSIEKLYYEYY